MWAEAAFRGSDDDTCEQGTCYLFEEVKSLGLLKVTKEYALYYWPDSDTWSGDVVDASGWHDLTPEECLALASRKGVLDRDGAFAGNNLGDSNDR